MKARTGQAKTLWTFDRYDQIATKVLVIVGALGVGSASLIAPIVRWVNGDALVRTVDTDVSPIDSEAVALLSGAELLWGTDARLTVTDPSIGVRIASIAPGLVLTVAAAVIAVLVLRLLSRVSSTEPFLEASVRWLRSIAVAVIVAPVLHTAASSIADNAVLDAALVRTDAEFILFSTNTVAISAVGLLFAALAEIFSRGAAMQHELRGLV